MYGTRKRSSRVWKPKTSQNLTISNNDYDEISMLKSTTKKLSIMNRLQNKNRNLSIMKNNRTATSQSKQRPKTTNFEQINSLGKVKRVFMQEKVANQKLLKTQEHKSETKTSKQGEYLKEGLLGQYEKYEKMGKRQLIEKLISLEYLANNIFKKNKILEQKIKKLQNQ